jgi:putative methionine-R-sulfoxide reductase with GAF domain
MTGLFKNRYSTSNLLAVLFILGTAASFYSVYSLPDGLRLTEGYQSAFLPTYFVLAITFILGGITLFFALNNVKEIIVYKDKVVEAAKQEQQDGSEKTTISLDGVIQSLQHTSSTKDAITKGLHAVCKELEAGQGAIYLSKIEDEKRSLVLNAGYALSHGESTVIRFEYGEGLVGQVAASGNSIYLDEIPEGYIKIISGLGTASPRYLYLNPIKKNDQIVGVIEVASFKNITQDQQRFISEATQQIAQKITNQA